MFQMCLGLIRKTFKCLGLIQKCFRCFVQKEVPERFAATDREVGAQQAWIVQKVLPLQALLPQAAEEERNYGSIIYDIIATIAPLQTAKP